MEVKLGDICTFQSGGTPSKGNAEFFNGTIPWITTVALNGGSIGIQDAVDWITDEAIAKSAAKVVPANSIMVGTRVGVGKVAINDVEMSTSQDIISLLNIDENRWDKTYLCKFLQGKSAYLNSRARGATIKGIKIDVLAGLSLEEIPVTEQKKIAEIIDKVNRIIVARRQELQKLDELIKARFVEMFDLSNCAYKSLGECTDFVDYRGHTPELSDEGTIRMINAKSVGKGFFKYVDEFITEKTYESWMHRGFGYPGDILFVTEGHTFGNTCLIPKDMTKFALGQRVITIKGRDEIENAFLCSYMQTDMFWKDINVYRTGGTAQGIRSKDLIKVMVPIPPIEQQKDFVKFVNQVDKSKAVVQKSLDESQMLFDSLMQKYFG